MVRGSIVFPYPDIDVHCLMYGSREAPEALLFFHGFLGSAEDWEEVFEYLELEKRRCIACDLPWHGKTIVKNAALSWQDLVNVYATAIANIPVHRKILVGYSMGGRFAFGIAATLREQIDGLIILSAHPGLEDEEERLERKIWELETALELHTVEFDEFLEKWYSQTLFETLRQQEKFSQILQRRFFQNDSQQLARACLALGLSAQPSYWQWLKQTALPVYYIAGARDTKYAAIAEKLRRIQNANIHVAVVEEAGHAVHLEKPREFREIVENFLSNSIGMSNEKGKGDGGEKSIGDF